MPIHNHKSQLWRASEDQILSSNLHRFKKFIAQKKGFEAADYADLHRWSCENLDDFWKAIWEFFEISESVPEKAFSVDPMPDTKWFEGERLNYV
ncbi:MAG: acetoacetate--CoA ligase, partial [Saprospiraceae bacterium]|nr:acetoacetate--CoA ligase [Saprospiraceae bacterium]